MAARVAHGIPLLCVLTLTGCSALSPQTVAAHKIADALPGVLGPARHYEVHVTGDPLALTRGRAHEIRVEGQGVQVSPSVTLDTLDFMAQNVSFDTHARRLDHTGRVNFVGTLGQAGLDSYMVQSGGQPGLAVTLRDSDMRVFLPISAGLIHTHVTVDGRVAPTMPGGRTISFIADRAHLSILPVPIFLVNQALDRINPVVDLSGLKVPISLQSADVAQGTLTLRGTADLDSLANQSGSS